MKFLATSLFTFLFTISAGANAAIVSTSTIYNDETIYFDASEATWWDLYVDNGWSVLDSSWVVDSTTFETNTLQFSKTGQYFADNYSLGSHSIGLVINWVKDIAGQQTAVQNEAVLIYGSNSPSPVPLPAAAWLFGSALLGFFGLSRRKQA